MCLICQVQQTLRSVQAARGLVELSSLIYQFEGFARYVDQSASNQQLSVTVDGQEVMAVPDSVTTTGEYVCDPGAGSYYFFCSELKP